MIVILDLDNEDKQEKSDEECLLLCSLAFCKDAKLCLQFYVGTYVEQVLILSVGRKSVGRESIGEILLKRICWGEYVEENLLERICWERVCGIESIGENLLKRIC